MSTLLRLCCCVSILCFSANTSATNMGDYYCGENAPPQTIELADITRSLYEVVSGKAGQPKNWDLLRDIFSPNGKIVPVFHEDERPVISTLSVDEFIALNQSIFSNVDFYESEVAVKIFEFGHMATILSHYESRDDLSSAPYSTGVNSFQLLHDGRRWCVISATWDSDKGPHEKDLFKPKDD